MTELMRPMLYGAFHRIEPVLASAAPAALVDFVGPIRDDRYARQGSAPGTGGRRSDGRLRRRAHGSVMASNYNRRPMPAEVRFRTARPRSFVAGKPSTIWSRSSCEPHAGCPHCVRRARSEWKADPDRCARRGTDCRRHTCERLSFPDYSTAIGTEIHKALHGEREYGPDVMQLLYVANRYEHRPGWKPGSATDDHLRSLQGVERRLRRGAGLEARWLIEIQRFLPAADLSFSTSHPRLPSIGSHQSRSLRT